MVHGLNDLNNKKKIAIVVVGYNKYHGLNRLLTNLNTAIYEDSNIPLVISIDASGNQQVYELAREFEWSHGPKYVNIEETRLGLKKHIFQCASLSEFFKAVIVLEDDLLVSPYFYHYAKSTVDKYGEEKDIAEIALYSNDYNGFAHLPFVPMNNGNDVFLKQAVCSWGEIWTENMWKGFMDWHDSWDKDFSNVDMFQRIKDWDRAWSKYYYAYLILQHKYVIYPYQSLSTNFNDAGGEHGGGNSSVVQVPLIQGIRNYQLGEVDKLVKYDVYSENVSIPLWLGLKNSEVSVDLYGTREMYMGRYVLSVSELPYKKVRGFGLSMRPWELNIKYNIGGDELFLYDRECSDVVIPPKRGFNLSMVYYYLKDFNILFLQKYIWNSIKKRIIHKLHING